jgi:hypothetical protein
VNKTITVTDTYSGILGTLTGTDSAPFTSHAYPYSRTVTAPAATCTTYNNTATITETGQSSSQSVKVCGASNLTATKTAIPSYTPGITKKLNGSSTLESGGSSTLNYTITATETGWQVTGNITVINPNNWEAVSVNLSDALAGATCTISGGSPQTVPAGGQISPAYKCTFGSAPAASGTNTASVTWNGATYYTPGSSVSPTANYAFASLVVTDQFNGGTTKTLGTITVPAASTTYTDSYTVTPAPGSCTTYTNIATGTEQTTPPTVVTAKASATACNTKTGALTMGFWQGPVGQGVINGSPASGGNCAVAYYIESTYGGGKGPFSDAPLTAAAAPAAPCSNFANYVGNVVNAAVSSGGGGLMLKGQMLATALTVYFNGSPTVQAQGTIATLGPTWILLDPIKGTEDVRTAFSKYNMNSPHLWGEQVSTMLTDASAIWVASGCTATKGTCTSNPYGSKTIMVYASDAFAYINQSQANIAP